MSIYTLQDYIQRVNKLQKGKPSPHKPFLLLIIIEMLESGELCENRIPFGEIEKKKPFFADLIAVFNSGNTRNWQPSLHNPFFHLKTNGFWHLDPPELQSRPAATTPTEAYLRNADATAKLDESLFVLLVIPEYRDMLRQTLINTYFSNIRHEIEQVIEKHRALREEHIEGDIEGYSEQLIQDTQHPFLMQRDVASIQVETPVWSAGFRKAIMKIYKYKCAVCELDIRTASGASITNAAHIIPFSVLYSDDVRNGLSLCKLHHWAFDARLFSLNDTYHIIAPPISHRHEPTERMLSELRDKRIWTPSVEQHRPHQEALAWHRDWVMSE